MTRAMSRRKRVRKFRCRRLKNNEIGGDGRSIWYSEKEVEGNG